MILRDNGYTCDEAVVYYVPTKQRVRVNVDVGLVQDTTDTLAGAGAPPKGAH